MKVEYTNRAVADLRKASADSRSAFGELVAAQLEKRIQDVVAHIAAHPDAAPQVAQRPGVRVFPLIRYPYKIFYRVLVDRIRIVHVRHASRRPWIRER
jgi:plasmid stabilization system protein ParE